MELSERLHSQWVESAQDWIDTDQAVRTGMLDSWMLDALGNVGGKSAIDIGCGEGRFSRLLSQLGASVTGVDLTEALIARARTMSTGETYMLGDAENLNDVESESFDIAVSYIVLVDLLDYRSAIEAAYRVLRPGGSFVVCNIHPCGVHSPEDGLSKRTGSSSTRWTTTPMRDPASGHGGADASSTCIARSPATSGHFWTQASLSARSTSQRRPKSSSPSIPISTTNTAAQTSSSMCWTNLNPDTIPAHSVYPVSPRL